MRGGFGIIRIVAWSKCNERNNHFRGGRCRLDAGANPRDPHGLRSLLMTAAAMAGGWTAVGGVILVWGMTFASTRALLADFSALEILLLRFSLAYAALRIAFGRFCGHREPERRGDGWLFAAMGFTGIVAYQFLENCAIYYTNASNVAILVSFGPVVTAVMARMLSDDRSLSPRLVAGSLVAVVGVALVSLNDVAVFELRPLGDLMALAAMVCWGLYSVLLDMANRRGVTPVVAVRRAFGWSLAMMAPFALWGMTESGTCALDGSFAVILDAQANLDRFLDPVNWMNLVFLGVLASAASFVLWSAACGRLGVVKTTISLYLTPLVGVAFATVFLGEQVTWLEAAGGCVILVGVAVATKAKGGAE